MEEEPIDQFNYNNFITVELEKQKQRILRHASKQ